MCDELRDKRKVVKEGKQQEKCRLWLAAHGRVVVLPCGSGSMVYKVGEVLYGFQKEEQEGFGHALIKGKFLGT